jgi:hypothetical protein
VRSSDGGTSWSLPTRLSFSDNQEDWDAVPVAAVDKDDHLHLLWVCENANRCYRTSQDGGVTWNDADRLYSPLLGSAGWDAMAADPFGSVYWVGALRYPMALYATSYDGARWHEPPVPAISGSESDGLSEAHRPQMAVGLGNKLHVTMVERDAGPVYYMLGTTANTATSALPLPTPTLGTVKAANDSSMAGTAEISGTYLGATAKQTLQVIANPIIAERTSYSTEVAPRVPFDSTLVTIVTVVITIVAASAAAAKHRR